MKFKDKNVNEALTEVMLCAGVEVGVDGNNIGNCPTNNNASGCGC